MADYAPTSGNAAETSPLAHSIHQQPQSTFSNRHGDDTAGENPGSSVQQPEGAGLQRTASNRSAGGTLVGRSNTLKKQKSLSRKTSLKRSSSRKSLNAGSIKGVTSDERAEDYNNVFYTPVPTTGAPTDILANRFQAWRKLLKELIAYFREVQDSYGTRAKALMKVSNTINNTAAPTLFQSEGGLSEAHRILQDYHKQAVTEANKAKDVENDVIVQLSGLRADLSQKIKEIKSLSGDFKNSVEKEKGNTRKSVATLQEALSIIDSNPHALVGKEDPYIIRLNVDRQVERQVDEENYLHRAYLNLEGSGRELESIVIGEIQKAYNALAGILKREADESYSTIEQLRSGPVMMPKDYEWNLFVERDPHFINPNTPLRKFDEIDYPGKHHPAAAEVRAGMLERKSKYLKSYTPGWYVLSPTHLHEFKSADRIYTQPPVMSLLLSDQKLGSRSQPGSSSHKFMIKGRQTGSMHRGHSWIFRAESYETMLAWYDDIQNLTEKTGEERNEFVRKHARSFSGNSAKFGSDSGLEEDEADAVPYSANQSLQSNLGLHQQMSAQSQRPQPGRFPSELSNNQINRHLQPPLSPSSGSSLAEQDLTTAAGGLQGENALQYEGHAQPQISHHPQPNVHQQQHPQHQQQEYFQSSAPPQQPQPYSQVPVSQTQTDTGVQPDLNRHDSNYRSWMEPVGAGAAIGAGAVGAEEYWRRKKDQAEKQQQATDIAEAAEPVSGNEPTHLQPDQGLVDTHDRAISEPSSTMTGSTAPTTVSSDIPHPPVEVYVPKGATPEVIGAAATGSTSLPIRTAEKPSAVRMDTNETISNLHIPGEYPRGSLA